MPSNLDYSKVKEFTILPKNGAFYLEMSYEVEKQKHNLDINQALSIDVGTADNLAVCPESVKFYVLTAKAVAVIRYLNGAKRALIALVEKLWDKYAVSSQELEAERSQTLTELNEFLVKLGYVS